MSSWFTHVHVDEAAQGRRTIKIVSVVPTGESKSLGSATDSNVFMYREPKDSAVSGMERGARRHPQWCTTSGGLHNTEQAKALSGN